MWRAVHVGIVVNARQDLDSAKLDVKLVPGDIVEQLSEVEHIYHVDPAPATLRECPMEGRTKILHVSEVDTETIQEQSGTEHIVVFVVGFVVGMGRRWC